MFAVLILTTLVVTSCGEKVKYQDDNLAQSRINELETILKKERSSELEFGIKTYPIPIRLSSKKIQEYGKAVAKIYNIDGSTGTGFFISSDGLFLTNDHVVEGKHCTKFRCPGVKLIRDMHIGGANQVYSEMEVIAYSDKDEDLDMTLLKIKIPDGEQVPFLELELNERSYNSKLNRTYKVLGHPGGADLRSTNVKPYLFENPTIDSLGLLIGGNSGGPLIDEVTGRVIGLIKEKQTRYDKKGLNTSVHHSMGRATSILAIAKNLKTQSILKGRNDSINALLGNVSEMEEDEIVKIQKAVQHIKAPDRRYFEGVIYLGAPESLRSESERLLINYIGTAYEADVIELMFKKNISGPKINPKAIENLFKIEYMLGRQLLYPEEVSRSIEGFMTNLDESLESLALKVLWTSNQKELFEQAQQICLAHEQIDSNPFIAISSCLSGTTANEKPAIQQLRELFAVANKEIDFVTHTAIVIYLSKVAKFSEENLEYLEEVRIETNKASENIETQMQLFSTIVDVTIGANVKGFFIDAF